MSFSRLASHDCLWCHATAASHLVLLTIGGHHSMSPWHLNASVPSWRSSSVLPVMVFSAEVPPPPKYLPWFHCSAKCHLIVACERDFMRHISGCFKLLNSSGYKYCCSIPIDHRAPPFASSQHSLQQPTDYFRFPFKSICSLHQHRTTLYFVCITHK